MLSYKEQTDISSMFDNSLCNSKTLVCIQQIKSSSSKCIRYFSPIFRILILMKWLKSMSYFILSKKNDFIFLIIRNFVYVIIANPHIQQQRHK